MKRIRLSRGGRSILRDLDWRITPGQRWIVAGANGAGKTQLLKLVAGAVWPTPLTGGARIYKWRGETWTTPGEVQDGIAYIGAERQDRYERYGWNHTARQVIGTGLHGTDIPLDSLSVADERRIERILEGLSIAPLSARRFLTLSYGERRLVLLARALASRPGLLLLDEPLNGLDAVNRRHALVWLERSARSKLPWVLATHRLEDVPASATHALVLERGRIVYRGVLAAAPLARELRARATKSALHAARSRSIARRGRPRLLVRLTGACVYLDEHAVLTDVSLSVRSGECWVVHGPNGSGKTTLLRTLYGDHGVAAGGRIERAGIKAGVPLDVFRRQVGLVAPHLQSNQPPDLSVHEAVLSGCFAAIGRIESSSRAQHLAATRVLARFGLARLAARQLGELSYGQLRRVLFARAWITDPRLLLLDEAFAGIDAKTRRTLQLIVRDANARGTAIVVATHHRSEWPVATTHELELLDGEVRYSGSVRAQ